MRPRTVVVVLTLFWLGLVLRGLATSGASGGADGPSGSSGQWTPAGTLAQAKAGAATVLLDDGRLLVTGGIAATGDGSTVGAVAGVEVYASSAGFSAAAPMHTARSGHTAVTLRDGRVLVVGGSASANPTDAALASAELYDSTTGAWTPVGSLADARSGHTASLLPDGRVLIAGGASEGVARASLEIFDPTTGFFSTAHAIATARTEHAAATLADGRVLLAGGRSDAGVVSSSIQVYDPVADTIVAAAMTGPRTGVSATRLLDGTVLIAGGSDGTQDLGTAEVFDPATSASVLVGAMATARRGHQAFLLPHNNSVLMVGGTSAGTPLAQAELFVPGAMAFRATGGLIEARLRTSGSPLLDEGRLVVTGGANGTGLLASAERYSFATVTTDWDDYAPGETVTITGEGWEPGETVTLRLHEAINPQVHDDLVYTAVADTAGRIYDNEFAPELDDVGVRFYLTAAGAHSQALTTFTDGELVTTEVVGTVNDVTVAQGATANFTIQVSATGPIKCTATAATPATATVRTVFAISSSGALSSSSPSASMAFFAGAQQGGGQNCDVTWTGAPTPYSVAASISTAATTPVGTYTIVLSASAGTTTTSTPSGNGSNLADATATNITIHVTAPADTTPPVITPTVTGAAGSNGWYVSDVTVSWSVTDPESSISSSNGCSTTTVNTDTTGVTFTCTATSTGGTSTKSVTVKRDTTPPTAAMSVFAGTAGAHGWYTSDVTVRATGTDSISSPVVCTPDQQVTTETTGTPVNGSCTNDAGLTTNAAPLTIKLDKTGPTAQLAVSAGTAGTNGWYTSDVTVHASGTDTISSPVVCTPDQQQTTETSGTPFNGSCTNDAGLTTSASALAVKLDKTGPTGVASTVTAGTLGAHGWYTSDVTIHTSGTDTISSPVTCSADQHQTTETTGVPFNGSCTNDAGLTTSAAPLTIKLDKTGPTAQLAVSAGTAGTNGWYTSDVTIHASGTDTISSPVTCSADQHQTTETAGAAFNGSCTNDAGLTMNAAPLTVKLDQTGPTGVASAVATGTLGAHGWYVSDVTVHTVGTDDISGPVQCTSDQTLTTDTPGQAVNASCTNLAGLTTNAAPLTVKLDKTGPSAELTVTSGTAGTNGWYISDVTVHASGTDSVSSPVTCTADQQQTTETAGTPFNGSCTNDAGLTTHASALTVKVDKTGPTGVASTVTAGTLGAHGWYVSDVTIHTSGADTISSPVTCAADQHQTTETAGVPFNGSCTNDAGLTTNAAPLTIKLDKTGPTADLAVTSGTAGTNGWYTSDVTVHANGTDTISSPVTCSPDQELTTETAGTAFNGSCTNDAGLTTNAAPLTVKLDKTGPTGVASAIATGTLGAHGWYVSDLTVHTVGTDDISGPVQCTSDQTLTTDTAGQAVNASCTNLAGLTTNAAPLTVKLDKTGPSADLAVTAGTAGTNGWYTSDVTIHASGTDNVSSPVTCTADQQQTAEIAGVAFNGSCTNDAGLTTNAAPLTVKLDKTGPTGVTSSVTAGTLGAHGWYISDVTVHTNGTDTISSPVTCTSDQQQTAETSGAPFNGSCTNDAGLTTSAALLTIKLDKTGPTAELTITGGTAGANGWYTSNVTIHASGADNVSGPITCTADQQQTTETAGTAFNGSCTNDAGLTTTAAPLSVKLDKTGPTGVASTVAAGTLGAHGWYVSDVTVHTVGTEDLSGPTTCTGDQTFTMETAGQSVDASCTNQAGLTTNAVPLLIKLDKTAPSAALSVTGGTGANGWFTSEVTVHATGTDSVSNPVTCSADQYQTAETTGANFNASCTNDAGLTTNAAPLTVKLDKTPPSATLAATGAAGVNGWFIGDVTVNTTGSDAISSPVVCTNPQSQTTDTTGTTFNGSCTNNAGLTASASPLVVKLDKTPPVITVSAPSHGSNVVLNANVPAAYGCTDATSGPASCSGPVPNGTNVSTTSVGSHSFTVTAKDNAGNTATLTTSYGVQFAAGLCLGEAGRSVLQPINVDGTSVFKQKSTVPVKFRVCDANGVPIGSGVVSDFRLVQIVAGTAVSTVNEVVDSTTPDTTFRFDPTARQWIFNTNTKALSASMTYAYLITLTDATTIQYQIGLK